MDTSSQQRDLKKKNDLYIYVVSEIYQIDKSVRSELIICLLIILIIIKIVNFGTAVLLIYNN